MQSNRRVTHALKNLLALPEARRQFVEVAQAVRHSRQEILALVLPRFAEWTAVAQLAANPSADTVTIDDDACDDVAVAAADFTRT